MRLKMHKVSNNRSTKRYLLGYKVLFTLDHTINYNSVM